MILILPSQASADPMPSRSWWPLSVHARVGVVHGKDASLVRFGGMLGYVGGGSQGPGGLFWVLGPAANLCMTGTELPNGGRDYYQGWSLGPEARLGWAWGTDYRKASLHLGLQPYLIQMWADSGRSFMSLGFRASVGLAYGHQFFGHKLDYYVLPNHIELVADLMRCGPFDDAIHWGISVGWEY
ncbi:MAG: hypothetical protein JRF33_13360 [Deltaproteobacteria bacterium]|nr:hypothetical protein [Deltaproteobacteria bacterium]